MDSKAQLALMAKAQKVFASKRTFLSFPVTPLVYSRNDLDLDSSKAGSAEEIAKIYENIEAFSLLVNLIPTGETWIPSDSRFLWDEYSHVLQRGTCAISTRTPEEQARYESAREFLKDRDDDGIERDSRQVVLYKQYEDAYSFKNTEFEEARFGESGEFAEDETIRQHWQNVLEPAFRDQLAEIERQWVLEGFKHEVEAKQNELLLLGAKSPLSTWLDWKASFDPDIDAQTGASTQLEVFPTSFSPINALEEGSWNKFELDSSTIETLVADAPQQLKERFGINSNETNIEKMQLEFSMGLLHRHWFNQDVLHARFWRLGDTSKVLSDGAKPAQGDCPAFVTGIVFARHITIKEKAKTKGEKRPENRPVLRPIGPLKLEFSKMVVGKPLAQRIDPKLLQSIHPTRRQPVALSQIRPRSRGARLSPATTTRHAGLATLTKPHIRPVTATPALASTLVRPIRGLKHLSSQRQFTRLDIAKQVPGIGSKPTSPPPQSDPDEIQILAFICTPVPKCPNPDATLSW